MNWRQGGRLLHTHHPPGDGVVTNVAIDNEYILVSLTNGFVHVFSSKTGVFIRVLHGHRDGVWALHLVSKGGKLTPPPSQAGDEGRATPSACSRSASPNRLRPPVSELHCGSGPDSPSDRGRSASPQVDGCCHHLSSSTGKTGTSFRESLGLDTTRPSDVCNASYGWGNSHAIAVTGSCDRTVRVWNVQTGYCLHVLKGHASTIRCVKALDGRPMAVSASRNGQLRVWDVEKGYCLRILQGHEGSVRALDVVGNVAVSGSYDYTARLWNVDTGDCIHVLRGHYRQIYSVAFDGKYIATGSLDSTVRLWDFDTGRCLALLQGHTSLVGNLQIIDGDLVTAGSDGRVIIFNIKDFQTIQRVCAHDNSVTTMQVDKSYLITGGNDGCVKLFERETGTLVRELTEKCDAVWKVVMRKDKCVIMCKREGKTVVEVWSFAPTPEQLCTT
ncbi:WD40-repeat-containing domain protein [Cantharellus anzutake]|uniref:WD40-repeat-containing domain protein n=1 Tax=Cantharellus anzutake TaxID=1750568 RepID=UPI0019077090|nr:WD40-repeat-containing domain protein [Cantharellus anzutake]KAF8329429.1 WD40-repeat-containing domain protein [Cantharellus anzutake]